MTVTTTIKGTYKIYASTSTDNATIISQLTEALANDGMASERIIYMNYTSKQAVAEVGR